MKKTLENINDPRIKTQIFDQREEENSGLTRYAQSRCMMYFKENNSSNLLVKSEGGDDKAIKMLVNLIPSTFHHIKTILFLDLDNKDVSQVINDIENRIRTKNKKYGILHETIEKNELILKIRLTLYHEINSNRQKIGDFFLLAFNKSLEDEAGIEDTDEHSDIESKICGFLDNSKFQEHLYDTIISN